jgi:hypothetical protein
MEYRQALDRVISAAVFYWIDDIRRQPDLKEALRVVIREQERSNEDTLRTETLIAAWMTADDTGCRQ